MTLIPKFSLNFVDLSNRIFKIFNPYLELKTHLHNYQEFNPKFGIALGNRFELSKKFFLSLECSYSQPEIIIQSKDIVLDKIIENKGYSIKRNSNISYKSNERFLKSGVFDMSVYEGYKFNKSWNMLLGAGLAFTNKLNNYLPDYQEIKNIYKNGVLLDGESNSLSELNTSFIIKKYTWFADLKISYSAHNHFRINLGYKLYFKNYYILTQVNSELYRQEINSSIGNTGLYFGLQYQF